MADTIKMGDGSIDPAKLKQIAAQYDSLKAEKDEASEALNEMLKGAGDTLGIHKGAFKAVMKLRKATPGDRADFLRAFDSYRHILALDDQPDMLDQAAA